MRASLAKLVRSCHPRVTLDLRSHWVASKAAPAALLPYASEHQEISERRSSPTPQHEVIPTCLCICVSPESPGSLAKTRIPHYYRSYTIFARFDPLKRRLLKSNYSISRLGYRCRRVAHKRYAHSESSKNNPQPALEGRNARHDIGRHTNARFEHYEIAPRDRKTPRTTSKCRSKDGESDRLKHADTARSEGKQRRCPF